MRSWMPFALLPALALAPSIAASTAHAQQPMSEFLDSAESRALDVREAEATLSQARSQTDEARARLLPSFTAQGAYTRNEFEAAFANPATGDVRVIQPYDALSATFQINVPLIDIGAWSGFFQAEALDSAAHAQLEATHLNVRAAVVQIWHQLVAARALVVASERNAETAESNRVAAAARVEVGVSPQLELSRAEAEVARANHSLSEARLQAILAARNLENLTGLVADDRNAPLEDDLAPEEALSRFLDNAQDLPGVRAARDSARAADIASDTAWTSLLPVISGSARETGSNAAGFTGQYWAYALTVQATWTLDFARPAQISTRAAAAEVASIRAERALQQIETGIYDAWQRVDAARARATAAESALDASRRAFDDAQARFEVGSSTQLDLIQAQRDVFQAEVAHIQAIADLRVARAVLRIRAGMDL